MKMTGVLYPAEGYLIHIRGILPFSHFATCPGCERQISGTRSNIFGTHTFLTVKHTSRA